MEPRGGDGRSFTLTVGEAPPQGRVPVALVTRDGSVLLQVGRCGVAGLDSAVETVRRVASTRCGRPVEIERTDDLCELVLRRVRGPGIVDTVAPPR